MQVQIDVGGDRIDTRIQRLAHQITGIVDIVSIVAQTTGHGVRTLGTIQNVIARIALERIGSVIARCIHIVCTGEGQVFHMAAQCP